MRIASVLVMVLLGLASMTQGAVVLSDHFDNGVLDPAWVVSYPNTDGYVGEESGTNYTVSQINGVTYGSFNEVRLTQSLSTPLTNDFQVNFDASWALPDGSSMQYVAIKLLDSYDVAVAGTAMLDAWLGHYPALWWKTGPAEGNTDANTQPLVGTGLFSIIRENGSVSITCNGTPIASGETTATIAKVQIAFADYFYSGVDYGSMSVDRVEVVAVGSQEPPVYGPNLVKNGDFATELSYWNYWATNGSVWDIYGSFGSITQWNAPPEANSCGSVSLDSVSGNPTPSILVTHTADVFGGMGSYQVVKVIPGTKYIVNADWKSSTGLPQNCWAEFIVYNATQAEVDNPSLILANVNDTFTQNCVVAKKDSWPNLNGGPSPWDWQPITQSMSGGFGYAAGTNELTATESYMVLLTKVGGTFLSEAYLQVDNVTLQRVGRMPGDANNDGMVDVGDLGILAANYGGSGKTWAQGDFNGDGLVDVGDLGILAANYGTGTEASGDFSADYAKAFGTAVAEDDAQYTGSSVCSALGLPLIAGLALMMSLLLIKVEE